MLGDDHEYEGKGGSREEGREAGEIEEGGSKTHPRKRFRENFLRKTLHRGRPGSRISNLNGGERGNWILPPPFQAPRIILVYFPRRK